MNKISDELRDWCDRNDENGCGGFVTEYSFEDICDLADRIDAELVELPRDKDGIPIHVGDTVYLDDGRKAGVTRIDLLWCTTNIVCWASGKDCDCLPSGISHTRPDSLERIADELDEMKERFRTSDSDTFFALQDLAGMVRTQAKERGDE